MLKLLYVSSFIILWIILFFSLIGMDLKISIFYPSYYYLYQLIIFFLIIFWFLLFSRLISRTKWKEINNIRKIMLTKDIKRENKYSIILRDIHNLNLKLFLVITFFSFLAILFNGLKIKFVIYKDIFLWLYFWIIMTSYLIYEIFIHLSKNKIKK